MNLNTQPPSFAFEQIYEDHDLPYPQLFAPNLHQIASSSSSGSCHFYLHSTQDHSGYYHHQLYQPADHKEDNTYAYPGGSSSYEIKNKAATSGLKLTLWKKEPHDDHDHGPDIVTDQNNINNPVKWMSSKMRLMHKMKNDPDRRALNITRSITTKSDHRDLNTRSLSHNNNCPIKVCSDCNTTKTPLWRSGPKGPKSLCNACGIRQRKARCALATANNGMGSASDQTSKTTLKIKVQNNKEKDVVVNNDYVAQLKKRYKVASAASSTNDGSSQSNKGQKVEDFLMNFSKNLGFHRVFPEDEKDAAILLMALSSGLVHG